VQPSVLLPVLQGFPQKRFLLAGEHVSIHQGLQDIPWA
jgi:hypothetical protein